jgi:hypothetical protein
MTTPRQRLIVEASDDTLHIPLPPELRHRRLVVTMEPVDRAASPPSGPNRDPEHIKRVLAEAWGAWTRPTPEQITVSGPESRPSPETIKRVLAETRGSWGNRSADEIDRMIEASRRNEWREPWLECAKPLPINAEAADSSPADS